MDKKWKACFLLIFTLSHTAFIHATSFTNENLANAAKQQIGKTLLYDPSYRLLNYPNGDVPIITGVCSDVIIRALRQFNIDLQQLIHEDMKNNFSYYPQLWQLNKPDKNIDHRRVANIQVYFSRKGYAVTPITGKGNYQPGDIIVWRLDNNAFHIGMISNTRNKINWNVIHNIGYGVKEEDVLFQWKIIGHYRIKK